MMTTAKFLDEVTAAMKVAEKASAELGYPITSDDYYIEDLGCPHMPKSFPKNSSTEQRRCGAVDNDTILSEIEAPKRQRSKNSIYYNKIARIIRKDTQRRLAGEI